MSTATSIVNSSSLSTTGIAFILLAVTVLLVIEVVMLAVEEHVFNTPSRGMTRKVNTREYQVDKLQVLDCNIGTFIFRTLVIKATSYGLKLLQ
ncbi:hypothetical protein FHG87_001099 [Trinorchestia longiramus]|nr:hypothetical protein FHG87_001099 [Trinorchestia longiramus]